MRQTIPQRIQRKRTAGFRLKDASTNPNGVVCVTRGTKWGNEFTVSEYGEKLALSNYRGRIQGLLLINPHALDDLRGKDLACWCAIWQCQKGHRFGNEIKPSRVEKYCPRGCGVLTRVPCHADSLLELANR